MAKRKRVVFEQVQVQPRLRYLCTVDVMGVPVFSVTGGKRHAAGFAEDHGVPFCLADILVDAGFIDEDADCPMINRKDEIRIRDATEDEKARFSENLHAGRTLACGYSHGLKEFNMQLGLLINPEDLAKLVGRAPPPIRL